MKRLAGVTPRTEKSMTDMIDAGLQKKISSKNKVTFKTDDKLHEPDAMNHVSTTTQTYLKPSNNGENNNNNNNSNNSNESISQQTSHEKEQSKSNNSQTSPNNIITMTNKHSNSQSNTNTNTNTNKTGHIQTDSITLRIQRSTEDGAFTPNSPNDIGLANMITPKDGFGNQTNSIRVRKQASQHSRTTSDNGYKNGGRSPSHSQYLERLDTVVSKIKFNQEKNRHEKKKSLLYSPYVVWYLSQRYKCTEDFTWCEWMRHFLPYPLVTMTAAIIQTAVLILLSLDTEDNNDDSDDSNTKTDASDVRLVQARLMAVIVLTAYVLMTGRNIRDFMHCIAFDGVLQQNICLFGYMLLPIIQGSIEAAALYISSVIILDSTTVVDVFKDTVAIMFVLEVDKWMGEALNMRDLGLNDESFIIDFSNDDSNIDELIVTIVYGGLLFIRGGVMAWAAYNCIFGSFPYDITDVF